VLHAAGCSTKDDANLVQVLKLAAGFWQEWQSPKAADLDERGVTNAQLDAFMRRSHLVGAQVHCWQ